MRDALVAAFAIAGKDLRAELRTRGFSRAAQFSWRACAARTLDVYREALTFRP